MAAPYPPVDGTQPCARQTDPDHLFFPARDESRWAVAEAKALCARCAFRRPCLRYALTHDVHGVWGGTTYPERRDLRHRHGIKPTPVRIGATA